MLSTQISYWANIENARHNKQTEIEATRHNVAQENETSRHNVETENLTQQQINLDKLKFQEQQRMNSWNLYWTEKNFITNREISQRNLDIGFQNAAANTITAQSKVQANENQLAIARMENAIKREQLRLTADANYINAMNAQTNRQNAETNKLQLGIAAYNAETNRQNASTNKYTAEQNSSLGWANIANQQALTSISERNQLLNEQKFKWQTTVDFVNLGLEAMKTANSIAGTATKYMLGRAILH